MTEKSEEKQLTKAEKPWLFQKGQSGNPAGKPKGTISPITAVKRIFAENPETFKEFLVEYMKNPNNARHIVEMIDGRPKGDSPTLNVESLENLTIVVKEKG